MKAWPLVVLAWGVVVACAASSHQATQAPVSPPPIMPPSPRDQITELSNQLEAQRTQMGLPEPAPEAPTVAMSAHTAIPNSHDQACHPAASQTCTDSCTLSDSICGNAGKICDLASQLQGDAWAADKCSRAKATCDAAHAKCCSCQL